MNHLRTLKYLNFAIAAYTLLIGGLFLALWVLPGLLVLYGGEWPGAIFVLAGLLSFLLLGGIGVAHAYTGFMITAGRARVTQTVLALMQLTNFPVGTAYALYALWVCWVDDKTAKVFGSSVGRRVH